MGGLGVKVQHFPLTLLVVLTTLTLPCERDRVSVLLLLMNIVRQMSTHVMLHRVKTTQDFSDK